jgi:hypothetical protein
MHTFSGNMVIKDAEDAIPHIPSPPQPSQQRREVLQRIADGELTVEDALRELETN